MTDPTDTPPRRLEIRRPDNVVAHTTLLEHTMRSGRQLVVEHQVDADGRAALQIFCFDHAAGRVNRITFPTNLVRELPAIAEAFADLERTRAVAKPRRLAPAGPALRARDPQTHR
jgi:hypothetical protein